IRYKLTFRVVAAGGVIVDARGSAACEQHAGRALARKSGEHGETLVEDSPGAEYSLAELLRRRFADGGRLDCLPQFACHLPSSVAVAGCERAVYSAFRTDRASLGGPPALSADAHRHHHAEPGGHQPGLRTNRPRLIPASLVEFLGNIPTAGKIAESRLGSRRGPPMVAEPPARLGNGLCGGVP